MFTQSQYLTQPNLQFHNHTTQFLQVGIYARYRAAISSPPVSSIAPISAENAEFTDASTSSPTAGSDHNTRLGFHDWPTSSSRPSDAHSASVAARQQSHLDCDDFGHGWQGQYMGGWFRPERTGRQSSVQGTDHGLEPEVRYRDVLGAGQDVLSGGRDQVLYEARRRPLSCSPVAGTVGLHDI